MNMKCENSLRILSFLTQCFYKLKRSVKTKTCNCSEMKYINFCRRDRRFLLLGDSFWIRYPNNTGRRECRSKRHSIKFSFSISYYFISVRLRYLPRPIVHRYIQNLFISKCEGSFLLTCKKGML